MGVITLPSALQAIREMFDDERNVKAAVAAYEELKV
jgi:pyruvate ferredoxin oxidoreductase gamma subunit